MCRGSWLARDCSENGDAIEATTLHALDSNDSFVQYCSTYLHNLVFVGFERFLIIIGGLGCGCGGICDVATVFLSWLAISEAGVHVSLTGVICSGVLCRALLGAPTLMLYGRASEPTIAREVWVIHEQHVQWCDKTVNEKIQRFIPDNAITVSKRSSIVKA